MKYYYFIINPMYYPLNTRVMNSSEAHWIWSGIAGFVFFFFPFAFFPVEENSEMHLWEQILLTIFKVWNYDKYFSPCYMKTRCDMIWEILVWVTFISSLIKFYPWKFLIHWRICIQWGQSELNKEQKICFAINFEIHHFFKLCQIPKTTFP